MAQYHGPPGSKKKRAFERREAALQRALCDSADEPTLLEAAEALRHAALEYFEAIGSTASSRARAWRHRDAAIIVRRGRDKMAAAQRSWRAHELRGLLLALAAPGDIALEHAPAGTCRPEELALDYDNHVLAYLGNVGAEISNGQRHALLRVHDLFAAMSGAHQSELWTESAVVHHPRWADVRTAAGLALDAMSWRQEPERGARADDLREHPAMNAMLAIHPYRYEGLWVFDDAKKGLQQEPFVSGADTILDRLVAGIPSAEEGFTLLFSAAPFPGYQAEFEWRREEHGGNWYHCAALDMEGWLCPALFRYFDAAPPKLYAQCKARTK